MVTTTFDAVKMRLFVDGIEDATPVSSLLYSVYVYINVGVEYNGGDKIFIGSIPYAEVYNRDLSSDEVLQNYNANKARFGR
jgi:hypothetical protein